MTARPGDRPALGRGLASLIPGRPGAIEAPAEIPLDRIVANPYQPRSGMDGADLEALAASIAEHGVLQPILVTETLEGYQLDRRRASRPSGADGRAHAHSGGRSPAGRPAPARARARREHPAIGPRPARGGPRLPPARRRVRADPGADRREGRPSAIDRRERGSPARARAGRPGLRLPPGRSARATPGRWPGSARPSSSPCSRSWSIERSRCARPRSSRDGCASRDRSSTSHLRRSIRTASGSRRISAGRWGPRCPSLARRRGGRIVIEFYSDEELGRLYDRLTGGPA